MTVLWIEGINFLIGLAIVFGIFYFILYIIAVLNKMFGNPDTEMVRH